MPGYASITCWSVHRFRTGLLLRVLIARFAAELERVIMRRLGLRSAHEGRDGRHGPTAILTYSTQSSPATLAQ
jgi:hypothetical protein